jgi:hypothetical protein
MPVTTLRVSPVNYKSCRILTYWRLINPIGDHGCDMAFPTAIEMAAGVHHLDDDGPAERAANCSAG